MVDLTQPENNIISNMTNDQTGEIMKSDDPDVVRKIDGQFSMVSVEGRTIRLARSISRPLRYFIPKLIDDHAMLLLKG